MTRRFLIAAALIAAATFASAQQLPPGKWWRRDEVVRHLGLSTDQQNRLDRIYAEAASDLIDARGEVEKASIALRSEIDQPQPNHNSVMKTAARLSAARGKLFERELLMLLDMRATLTEQQWTKMRNVLDRMEQNRKPRMDGGNPDDGPDGPPNGPNPGRGNRPQQRPRPNL